MAERPSIRPVSPLPILTVIGIFLTFAVLWAFAVPLYGSPGLRSVFQPDEPNHISVVRYIAREGTLPPYTFAYYESAHPPLYHLAAAGVYRLSEPMLGEDGAVHLLRIAGGGLGAALIWLVWQTALPMVGKRAAFLAASLAGAVPMFVSLSASVSNETLAALAGAGAIAALTAGVRRGYFDTRTLIAISLWTAVGVGTKVTCLGLIPISVGVVGIIGLRKQILLRNIGAQICLILLVTAVISGWWYVRNLALYGDPLRRAEASAMWHERIPGYASLAEQGKTTLPRYTARVTFWGWASFWGVFSAFRDPLPAGVYVCLAAFQGLALGGIYRLFKRSGLARSDLLPLVIPAAPFAASVAMVYYRYTWDHYTPQGRFFFPLLLPFAIVTAVGWLSQWPRGNPGSEMRNARLYPSLAMVFLLVPLFILNSWVLLRVRQASTSTVPVTVSPGHHG